MGGAAGGSPCASCKLLRRRCAKDCIFAPYFPSDNPHKFAIVHKIFGASNISKMLQELPVDQRADAVSSLVYEANARVRDPVYGCVGAISYLQNQVSQLQMQLAMAKAEIVCIQVHQHDCAAVPSTPQIQLQEAASSAGLDYDDYDYDHNLKSSFLHQQNHNNNLPQYFNFTPSNKKESFFGHDMVS